MISDARGGHVSPGIYTEEKDVTYSAKSLGITSLGLVGETVKGPAFQAIPIEDWSEFVDYFGGTSPEKYKGTNLPKYELPYIAESYLQESKRLNVVRVLGLSGYEAGSAMTVTVKVGGDKTPAQALVVLRSKADYLANLNDEGICDKLKNEGYRPWVKEWSIGEYTSTEFDAMCSVTGSGYTIPLSGEVVTTTNGNMAMDSAHERELGSFSITFKYEKTPNVVETVKYNVSLNPMDRDYIYNVFSVDPLVGSAPVYIEAVYDYAYLTAIAEANSGDTVKISSATSMDEADYYESYRCAQTPWIVSEVKNASAEAINLKKLFKVYTISDGNAANFQVKISIQKIRPDEGLFDLWVRDFYDTDTAPVVLEKFSNLSMIEGASNYIGLKIGTFDGGYPAKSKYITVELSDEEGVESCVPCGFLGYPMPFFGGEDRVKLAYNKIFDDSIKPKRQYFGLNSDILDEDVLTYKGVQAYNNGLGDADPDRLTNGFHLDAILSMVGNEAGGNISGSTIYVDGESGYVFTTVEAVQPAAQSVKMPRLFNEGYTTDTIYEDINLRKFTVYPYGGFDGWDIYRDHRTNGDEFKATKYAVIERKDGGALEASTPYQRLSNTEIATDPTINLGLPANSISSDYYAYLAGYKQFANPQDVDINLFATPGIDFHSNTLLVEDALDIIEDQEDGRGGDALYIITSPMYNKGSNEILYADDVIERLEDAEIKSSYACTYFPWVKYYDSNTRQYIDLPVTKDVVRNMAMTDNTSYPWFAPAGVERGPVDCIKAIFKTTLSDEDTLYEGRINPTKTFAQDGVKIWGNKTLYTRDTPLNRINVRRLMLRVKKLVVDASKSLIFEQYDASLEKQFKSLVEPILAEVKSNRGIVDYRVVTECTPETRDQHILPAKILIKPTPALEYISITFTVYPESVQFDEAL